MHDILTLQPPSIEAGADNSTLDSVFDNKVLPSFMLKLQHDRDVVNGDLPLLNEILAETNELQEQEKRYVLMNTIIDKQTLTLSLVFQIRIERQQPFSHLCSRWKVETRSHGLRQPVTAPERGS